MVFFKTFGGKIIEDIEIKREIVSSQKFTVKWQFHKIIHHQIFQTQRYHP